MATNSPERERFNNVCACTLFVLEFWNRYTFGGLGLNEILRWSPWGNLAPHSRIPVIVALLFFFGLIQPKWIRILAQIESSFPPGEASRTYCDKISQRRLPPQYETSVKKIPRIYFNLNENIKRNHFRQNQNPNKKMTVTEVTPSFMMFLEDVDLQHKFVKSLFCSLTVSTLSSERRNIKDSNFVFHLVGLINHCLWYCSQ